MDKAVIDRIKTELSAAGIISKTLINLESKALAAVLFNDEHIGGAVHGTYPGGLAWLVATNKRVLFMDRKPFFSSMDEVSYDVVSGAKATATTLSDSVTLHTRMGDYTVNYVRAESAHKFIQFIEKMRLGSGEVNVEAQVDKPQFTEFIAEEKNAEAINFLRAHDLVVLSTIDRTGNLHGAVVNYLIDQNNTIYILTKSGTTKGRNIFSSSKVALTVYDEAKLQSAQIQGEAEVETNQANKNAIHDKLTQPRNYGGKLKMPPVTKLEEGEFMVIKIKPIEIKYHDYS